MKKLGNPIAVMAASEALKDKNIRNDIKDVVLHVSDIQARQQKNVLKIGKVALITGGTLLGLNLISKIIREQKKRKLLETAGTDTDVNIALLIYDEIPSKHKKSHIPLVGVLFDQIKQFEFWSSSSDDKLIGYANQIKDINKVVEVFKVIYLEDFFSLLQKTMTAENYVRFLNIAKKDKTPLNTLIPEWGNKYAVAKKDITIYRIAVAKEGLKAWGISIPVKKGTGVGKATGVKKRYEGKDYMETTRTVTKDNKNYLMTFFVNPNDVELKTNATGTSFTVTVYPDKEVLVPLKK